MKPLKFIVLIVLITWGLVVFGMGVSTEEYLRKLAPYFLMSIAVCVLQITLELFFAVLELINSQRRYRNGEVADWIKTNKFTEFGLIPDKTFIYQFVAWISNTKYELSEKTSVTSFSGLVIPDFKFKLFRFLPK